MTATSRSNSPDNNTKKPSTGRTVWLIIWTTFKFILIPAACIAALICGLIIGYVVLGKAPMSEVFDGSTWKHMYDLVFREGG